MPLYKVGIGDIGTKPQEAERALKRLFDMADARNAILLMCAPTLRAIIPSSSKTNEFFSDEADVFLDSRGTMGEAEIEKNAMVAGENQIYRCGDVVFAKSFSSTARS